MCCSPPPMASTFFDKAGFMEHPTLEKPDSVASARVLCLQQDTRACAPIQEHP